jgi:hypothetical protein
MGSCRYGKDKEYEVPVILNVKDGFHHDLNAIATEDMEGPSFPCHKQ